MAEEQELELEALRNADKENREKINGFVEKEKEFINKIEKREGSISVDTPSGTIKLKLHRFTNKETTEKEFYYFQPTSSEAS